MKPAGLGNAEIVDLVVSSCVPFDYPIPHGLGNDVTLCSSASAADKFKAVMRSRKLVECNCDQVKLKKNKEFFETYCTFQDCSSVAFKTMSRSVTLKPTEICQHEDIK